MTIYESWGRYPKAQHRILPIRWLSDEIPWALLDGYVLPFGLGRSYGDVCLNDNGWLLATRYLNHFIAFDLNSGIMRCEAGVSLAEILQICVPRGWFLPVTPGTKYVTVGGAIANDVHGKNHHRAGTFGRHVLQFELLRSNGERLFCSPMNNVDYFKSTIGGLGLTGLITWAEIQLIPFSQSLIETEIIRFAHLDEFYHLSAELENKYEYCVAWVDCFAKGNNLGRGIFMCGNHADRQDNDIPHQNRREKKNLRIPVDFPAFILNSWTTKAFNCLYYHIKSNQRSVTNYESFFYPLDVIIDWNRIYGKRGFFQYQCLIPLDNRMAINAMLRMISKAGIGSFLGVLKVFGDIPSPGMLSFPDKGVTLALDFPNRGAITFNLFNELDAIMRDAGGRLYPAKDARMLTQDFKAHYPQWENFTKYIDPKFSSSFWRRVTKEPKELS